MPVGVGGAIQIDRGCFPESILSGQPINIPVINQWMIFHVLSRLSDIKGQSFAPLLCKPPLCTNREVLKKCQDCIIVGAGAYQCCDYPLIGFASLSFGGRIMQQVKHSVR